MSATTKKKAPSLDPFTPSETSISDALPFKTYSIKVPHCGIKRKADRKVKRNRFQMLKYLKKTKPCTGRDETERPVKAGRLRRSREIAVKKRGRDVAITDCEGFHIRNSISCSRFSHARSQYSYQSLQSQSARFY